jgi:hypothetical protein
MDSPEWSEDHITRANRFATHVVLAWLALVALDAILVESSGFRPPILGAAVLGAIWLLVQSLFTQVDELVKTRLEELDG